MTCLYGIEQTPPAAILALLTAINIEQEVILCVVLLDAQLSKYRLRAAVGNVNIYLITHFYSRNVN